MTVKGTHISMVRGDTEVFRVKRQTKDGQLIPLSVGDTIYFTVKEKIGVTIKVLQKVVTVFDNGTAIIHLDPIDTKSLKFKDYSYDIQLTYASGAVTTIIPHAILTIEAEVTDE